jgi:hypothetical protein
MKIRLVGAELLHTDGQTDVTRLIVAFCKFTNVPRKDCVLTGAYFCHLRSYVSRRADVVPVFLYGFLTRFRVSVFRFVREAVRI